MAGMIPRATAPTALLCPWRCRNRKCRWLTCRSGQRLWFADSLTKK